MCWLRAVVRPNWAVGAKAAAEATRADAITNFMVDLSERKNRMWEKRWQTEEKSLRRFLVIFFNWRLFITFIKCIIVLSIEHNIDFLMWKWRYPKLYFIFKGLPRYPVEHVRTNWQRRSTDTFWREGRTSSTWIHVSYLPFSLTPSHENTVSANNSSIVLSIKSEMKNMIEMVWDHIWHTKLCV